MADLFKCVVSFYIFVVLNLTFKVVGHGNSIDACKPVCSCYMNGIYYEHGDQWKDKDDPCKIYECKDGYYIPIYQGCMFKNECKLVGTVWTEGCFTYECLLVGTMTFYDLKEGGCLDSNGNCLKVGERVPDQCDTVQCQISGNCYELKTIAKGCQYAGSCKPLHSVWNDGCSLYQCINDTHTTRYERLENDVMYWPDGNYALLMSIYGCPRGVEGEWLEGYRLHYGEGHSYTSPVFNAFGNYTKEYFNQSFCSHVNLPSETKLPRYQTYWDPGNYCILRRNGTCPKSFKEGFITFDDIDDLEILQKTSGTVPDGIYFKDTTLFFCCRSDGYLNKPIVLPRDHPFILFIPSGQSDCQEVRGMTYSVEYFAFDEEIKEGKIYRNGFLPLNIRDPENITAIYFCYYKPLQCGCTDKNGDKFKVGERVELDCVWYICRDEGGTQYMEIEQGGCEHLGRCKNESETWIESSGESCQVKECKRSYNGIKTTFIVQTTLTGCKDEDECRPKGYLKIRGCYVLQCKAKSTLSPVDMVFDVKRAGCSDGKGGCIGLGENLVRNCIVYKCKLEESKCGLEYVSGECEYEGKCRAVNSVWTSPSTCDQLKCSMVKKSDTIFKYTVDVIEYGCKHSKGCLRHKEEVVDDCITKQCKEDKTKHLSYLRVVSGGCLVNNTCIKIGQTFMDDCNVRKCFWDKGKDSYKVWTQYMKYGCKWDNQCLPLENKRKKDCITYQCVKERDKVPYMKPILFECSDGIGGCLKIGTTIKESGCVTRQCTKFPDNAYMEVKNGGCSVNGECKDHLSKWTDHSRCATYQCKSEKQGNKWYAKAYIVAAGCRVNGVCKRHLSKWTEVCTTYQCRAEKQGANWHANTNIIADECQWEGKCIQPGVTRIQNCLTYKCQKDSDGRAKMNVINYECSDGKGGCIKVGKTIKESNCFVKKCAMLYGKTYYTIVKGACSVDGKCRDHLSKWTQLAGCRTYQCKVEKRENKWFARAELVDAGCQLGTTCKANGTVWDKKECSYKTCHVEKTKDGFKTSMQSVSKGCSWGVGCISPGKTVEKVCVTYMCKKNSDNTYNLEPTSYGCNDGKGGCVKAGATIQDSKCYQRKCTMVNNRPQMIIVNGGCKIGGECRLHLSKWTEPVGCATYQCQVERRGNSWYAKTALVGAGCRWGDTCKEGGEQWDIDKCFFKKCIVKETKRGFERSIETYSKGCKMGDGCLSFGETRVENCVTYTCQKENNVRFALKATKYECSDGKGGCVKLGSTLQDDNCFLKKCTVQFNHAFMAIVKGGCKIGKTCKSHLSQWTDPVGCATYQCRVEKQGNRWFARTPLVNAGCRWSDTCKVNGEEWTDDNCTVRKCIVEKTKKGFKRSIQTQSHSSACVDLDGKCRKLDETWDQIYLSVYCYKMQCQQVGNMSPRAVVLRRLCLAGNGKCRQC